MTRINKSESFNFKLLAIRPLEGCASRFSKNLTRGKIYKFYDDFNLEILETDGITIDKVKSIDFNPVPESLYRIKSNGGNTIDVNISAIVGKNGSGKSTLLELFYTGCFVAAYNSGFISEKDYDGKELEEITEALKDLKAEFYYSIGNKLYVFKADGKYRKANSKINVENKLPFYSIAVNYSLYGLNGLYGGNTWLNTLFHKNDGYQTPLVINPYRIDGNIDVNSELHLAQSRLLSNLVDERIISQELIKGKNIDSIKFTILYTRLDEFESISYKNVFNTYSDQNKETVVSLFKELARTLINYEVPKKLIDILEDELKKDMNRGGKAEDYLAKMKNASPDNNFILYLLMKYSIRKVFKICRNYKEYRECLSYDKDRATLKGKGIPVVDKKLLLQNLALDKSHITLKLRQIFHTIKERYYEKWKWKLIKSPVNANDSAFETDEIKITDIVGQIKSASKTHEELTIETIPAAFWRPSLLIDNGHNKNDNRIGNTNFALLSSGEQQLIHSIQSILYHVANVNSVFDSKNGKRKTYEYINIILDEIELYYHPEFQRSFVLELLTSLGKMVVPEIKGINILFSTHSPFILSDIPTQNILKLEEGDVFPTSNKTFGANIHDLLANDFFLRDGYMGNWAKKKIREIICGKPKNQNHADTMKIIDLIGEPILRESLREAYFSTAKASEIDEEIKRLQKLKKKRK